MTSTRPELPPIPEEERSPLVDTLLEFINRQARCIEEPEDEIQKLKKETRKPKIESGKMDKNTGDGNDTKKKPTGKRDKTDSLKIDEEQAVRPEKDLPKAWHLIPELPA